MHTIIPPDIEASKYLNRHNGFASAAAFIASDPDNETFLYRKFDELAARNLLYLQCEVLALESKLSKLDEATKFSDDPDIIEAARSFEVFIEQHEKGDQDALSKMALILKIREKIKDYHEALLLQSEIVKLKRPPQRVLEVAQAWFRTGSSRKGIRENPILGGAATDFLTNPQDLACLKAPQHFDPLSRLLRRHWPATASKSTIGQARIGYFNERHISYTVVAVSTLVASALLVGSIVALYFVKSPGKPLGLLGGFTGAFALSVALLTNAQRVEIFAATAAYAAVLVVFVSSGGLAGNCPATDPNG